MLNIVASKVLLNIVLEGVDILAERSDNKIDDRIVGVIHDVLNPEEVLSAAFGDGIEEEDKARALSEKK